MIRNWRSISAWAGLIFLLVLQTAQPVASPLGTSSAIPSANEEEQDTHAYEKLRDALQILMRVPSGMRILIRAEEYWKLKDPMELTRVFRWGEASKTDAVITRYFNPKTGGERRERKVTVLLRREQKLGDLVLDIAHELVHATARSGWDPYDPNLSPSRYIRAAIEGEGGEVDAVVQECKVSLELAALAGLSSERCLSYVQKETGALDRERVLKDFYRVGVWREELIAQLGREVLGFPWLSAEHPRLYSSTGRTPYPVALLREYQGITEVACENSKRRLSYSAARQPSSAENTSEAEHDQVHQIQSVMAFLQRRCPSGKP